MIQGIPFFGEQHNSIMKEILEADVNEHIKYETMTDLICSEVQKHTVVVIDNEWFSWLHDVQFNYRDSKVYLPYYTYELFDIETDNTQSLNRGHVLLSEDKKTWQLRFNYDLKLLPINIKEKLTLFDLDTHKKYFVSADDWYYDTFNIDTLYLKYLSSAYYDFDELLEKRQSGYHYINRQFKGFRNVEWNKRKALELPNFKENQPCITDFRDVRQYRKEELFGNTVRETIIPYKLRRLMFDSLLYCIIKQDSKTDDAEFNSRYAKLKTQDCILNYRPYYNAPPLIFKSYWYGVDSADAKRSIRKHV